MNSTSAPKPPASLDNTEFGAPLIFRLCFADFFLFGAPFLIAEGASVRTSLGGL